MKKELYRAFVDGFKDSFRLAAWIFVAVAGIIGAFSNHESPRTKIDNHQRAG